MLHGGDRLEFRQATLATNYGVEDQRGESYTFIEKEQVSEPFCGGVHSHLWQRTDLCMGKRELLKAEEQPPEMSRHKSFWNSEAGNTRTERSHNTGHEAESSERYLLP